jgi:hypothetical protein
MFAKRQELEVVRPPTGPVTVEGWSKNQWLLQAQSWVFNGLLTLGDVTASKHKGKTKWSVSGTITFPGQAAPQLVSGEVLAGTPHILDLTSGKQRMRLMRFTREADRGAGVIPGKQPVGVWARLLN